MNETRAMAVRQIVKSTSVKTSLSSASRILSFFTEP